ncbi:SEC-C metal-binding domain-containing protein [Bacillus sp. FJAT-27245]|uniref:SEC-C metal-binding domain-containing protein n=1 Tax=Bacillus sp. FJAT-27245 TaxID=1684144 RepID=UPI000A78B06E|nr:SEC-C metal-binding domain-containing protein [Bacillus sp. FJAT-27245]
MSNIGRNDKCPCGSGKKYKKCCGKGSVVQLDQLLDKELQELQADMIRYTWANHEKEIRDYLKEHYKNHPVPKEAIEVFEFCALTWFATSLEKNGKTVIDEYLDSFAKTISRPKVKAMAEAWRNSYPSVFRAAGLENGNFLTVEDVFTKETSQIKLLQPDYLPEQGDLMIGTVLLSEPKVFFGTFFNIPAHLANEVKREILALYKETGNGNPKSFMKDSYLVAVDRFMFPEPLTIMDGWKWPSEKHRKVAEAYQEYINEIDGPITLVNLGLKLWIQYTNKANPAIRNPQIYTAALIYLTLSHSPNSASISQKQLAEAYGTSPGSISSKYRDMKKILKDELEEIGEISTSA